MPLFLTLGNHEGEWSSHLNGTANNYAIWDDQYRTGYFWLAAFNGLYHSADAGKTFARLGGVQEIHAFGFGKGAPRADAPALYPIGIVNGLRGIFRSDSGAQSWVRINDDQHQWGLLLHITGDPKQYGRVYVGTHGRGTWYGDPRP